MTDNHPARTAPQQARTPADPTPDHDPSTARQLADDLIAGARRAEPVRHRGAYTLNATGFVLDSGGPRCDVTIVFDPAGDVDYAVLDYSQGGPRAFRVIDGSDAELLHEALRRHDGSARAHNGSSTP